VDPELFKILGGIAGIGGIAVGACLLLFKDIIAKNIFPKLPAGKAYQLLVLIVVLFFVITICCIGAYVFLTMNSNDASSTTLKTSILNEAGQPQMNIKLWSSKGTASQDDNGRWQVVIPAPENIAKSHVRLFAEQEASSANGKADVELTGQPVQHSEIVIAKNNDGTVFGAVVDTGGTAQAGVDVYVQGYSGESIETSKHGEFKLIAHAATGATVRLCARKAGFADENIDVQVGSTEPVTLMLGKGK